MDMASVIINVNGNEFNENGAAPFGITKSIRTTSKLTNPSLRGASQQHHKPTTPSHNNTAMAQYLLDMELSQHSPDLIMTANYSQP